MQKYCGKCDKKIDIESKNRCRECYLAGQKTRGAHRFWRWKQVGEVVQYKQKLKPLNDKSKEKKAIV
tara:strand:- start:154 stop:354 length:201 start_codon:yes stop_codon:yes gene_type:complete